MRSLLPRTPSYSHAPSYDAKRRRRREQLVIPPRPRWLLRFPERRGRGPGALAVSDRPTPARIPARTGGPLWF